ncbi:hypothetical protein TWF481_005089 [Arthrobotrys musiformis]|uniref:Uncharacterized protein n=1 Tax=Arthrobotrys musiformis TaxID=47236 RepID=A0AAV9WCV6_9PEZI
MLLCSVYLTIVWISFPLIPKVVAPANIRYNRAPGCGAEPATITRQYFDAWFSDQKSSLQALAQAIEELDYLQEEGRCPSDVAYITEADRDTSYHIQPLIDRLFRARFQIGELVQASVEDDVEGYATYFDQADLSLTYQAVYKLERQADAEKDAVDALVADIANLPRLRYPDSNDQAQNVFDLAFAIDEGFPDGEYLVEYVTGARQNIQDRFDSVVKKIEKAIKEYDAELAIHDIRDKGGELDEWFPQGNSYRDIVGALIRWSYCWLEGVKGAAETLRAIPYLPEPDPRPERWGALGRGLSRIGRSFSSIGGRRGGQSRTPPRTYKNARC